MRQIILREVTSTIFTPQDTGYIKYDNLSNKDVGLIKTLTDLTAAAKDK